MLKSWSLRQRLRLALLTLGLLSVALHAWDLATPGLLDRTGRLKGPDFLQFYTYGSLAREHHWARLYDPNAHAEMAQRRVDIRMALTNFRPNYSPIVAAMLAPFTSLSFLRAWMAWSAISLALYAISVALIAATTSHIRLDRVTLALAAMAFPALFIVIRYGQISALSLLLVAMSGWLYARRQFVAAGLALGALVYKPHLLVVPLLALTVTREWRVLFGLCLAIGLESAANLWLVGWSGLAKYVESLTTLATNPDLVQAFPAESHSARGFVRLLVPWPPLVAFVVIAAVAIATWAVDRVWRRFADPRPRWAALTVAMLIATPHLLTYDLLLLAVPLVLTVDWAMSTGRALTGTQWTAMIILYGAAWPGTFVARLYGIQPSTIGMALTLWLLAVSRAQPDITARREQ